MIPLLSVIALSFFLNKNPARVPVEDSLDSRVDLDSYSTTKGYRTLMDLSHGF